MLSGLFGRVVIGFLHVQLLRFKYRGLKHSRKHLLLATLPKGIRDLQVQDLIGLRRLERIRTRIDHPV